MRTQRPLRRVALRSLWQQALWAIPFALFFGVLFGVSRQGYLRMLGAALVFSYSIRLFLLAAQYGVLPRLARRAGEVDDSPRLGWWIDGLVCAIAAIVGAYVAAAITHLAIIPGFLGSPRAVLTSGMFALIFTVLFTGVSYAIYFHGQALERARAVELARAELARAELRALRAQVNPHFLFNTLNTIAALIAENPHAAEETTTRLADVFRYALQASDHEQAPLGDELAFVRAYLEIERTRFGERLRVQESVEPALERVPVPSLLLQPLVENAVRHGVASRTSGGTVRLAARRQDGRLVLEIGDDGPGMSDVDAPSGTGFGLHSVRERLRAAGLPEALAIDSAPGRGTTIRVTLPLPPDPSPPAPSKGATP